MFSFLLIVARERKKEKKWEEPLFDTFSVSAGNLFALPPYHFATFGGRWDDVGRDCRSNSFQNYELLWASS